jgi:uncharacterized protein (DUF2249 family)/hemerythrin-like domain-containing protein
METVLVASSQAEAAAARSAREHHAELTTTLRALVETLLAVTAQSDWDTADAARQRLVTWARHHLWPHAQAEEAVIYPAARSIDTGRLLVDALLAEHGALADLIVAVDQAVNRVAAAAKAEALLALFSAHVAKEDEQVIPLLAEAPEVSLDVLLRRTHALIADAQRARSDGAGYVPCNCGEADTAASLPELDARAIPHAIRHATVLGALDQAHHGGGILLIAPHDPVPLLTQLERRSPGVFQVSYVERGPDTWRLSIVRR